MKKRITSLILMICLLMQSACIMAGATPAESDAVVPEVSQAVSAAKDFLVKLGVIDADFDVNGIATKSSFLCMALDVTKVEAVAADKQYFKDVPLNYYAANEIATGYNVGYIKGSGNGTFSPDKIISVNEASTIAMNILNYGHLAGTASYQRTIKNQGLLKDVDTNVDGTLNNGACIVLLKNMLMAQYNMLSGTVGDAGIYQTDGNTTLLYVLYSIIRTEGVVTAVDDIYLHGRQKVNQGQLSINNVVINDEEGLANDLLGFNVEAFVVEDESSYSLFEIYKATRGNEELIIEAEDLTNKSTANKIVYKDESNREKTITLPQNYTLIYNSKNYNGFTTNVFHITQGKIRLISNNANDYSLIYVYEYENVVVKSVDAGNQKIYVENSTQPIEYRDPEDAILLDATGEPISGADLYTGLVLTMFKSKGTPAFYTIKAGRGDYIMTPDGMDDEYIYMGEEKVRMTAGLQARRNEIKLGTKTVLSLDAFGEAVDFKHVTTDVMYGYLVDIEEADVAFDTVYDVKIFTENNKMAIYRTDKYFKVNDSKLDATTAINNFRVNDVCQPQLIKFTATEDNILKEVWKYTDKSSTTNYAGYDENNFTLDYMTGSTFQYRGGNQCLDTKYFLTGATLRFIIPTSGNEKDYKCTTCATDLDANITSGVTYKLFDSSKERVAAVLLEQSNTLLSDFAVAYQAPVVVTDTSIIADEEGFTYFAVNGYLGDEKVRYITDDENLADTGDWSTAFAGVKASELMCGDVVQFNVSGSTNEIYSMRILYMNDRPNTTNVNERHLYDEEHNASSSTIKATDYYAWLYTTSAEVKEQYDSMIVAHTNRNATANGEEARNRVMSLPGTAKYYVYESESNTLTKTDKTEYMIGNDVFVAISLSSVKIVVIYK